MVAEGVRRRQVMRGGETVGVAGARRRPLLHRCCVATVALAVVILAHRPSPAATFDFVHVEANAGGSSGGHVALCLTERCYHFQNARGAELVLMREPRERFEHGYRAIGNRTLVVRRVELSDATLERIVETFEAYHRMQDRQLAVADAYAEDVALLSTLRARARNERAQPTASRIPAAGYFFADAMSAALDHGAIEERSPIMAALARDMEAAYGSDVLSRRAAELRRAIEVLRPATADDILPQQLTVATEWAGLAARHRELLTGYLAIAALRQARGLRSGTYIVSGDADFALTETERDTLAVQADALRKQLVRLIGSRRPDWGFPLLVGMARLLALDRSVASGSLVLLDTFPQDPPTVSAAAWRDYESAVAVLVDERRVDLRRARAAFFAEPGSEARWSRVEMAGNLLHEMARAHDEHAVLRVHDDSLVPMQGAWHAAWPIPELTAAEIDGALVEAQKAADRYNRALHDLYAYSLIERNCATELLRTIDSAVAGDDGDAQMDPNGGGRFVPFIAAHDVGETYRVVDIFEEPSVRRLALSRSYADENPVIAYLREANVVSARFYRWHAADPVFLFFSDDAPFARPLFGALNLVTSSVASLAGVVSAPLDSGALLAGSLNGVLYSLPELGFVSIRKGSFPIAPRAWLPQAATTETEN